MFTTRIRVLTRVNVLTSAGILQSVLKLADFSETPEYHKIECIIKPLQSRKYKNRASHFRDIEALHKKIIQTKYFLTNWITKILF